MRSMTPKEPRPFTENRLIDLLQRENTFWRHDVDVSLESAVKMAELEHTLGVRATYYLMIASPDYLASDAFLAALTLEALGHRIGLHVDERHWTPNRELAPELNLAAPVSFHCPTEDVLWQEFPGIENAYGVHWEGKYYSDSGGVFRFGDPEDHPPGILQINLHPDRWFDPECALRMYSNTYESFFHEPHPLSELEGPGDAPITGSWAPS